MKKNWFIVPLIFIIAAGCNQVSQHTPIPQNTQTSSAIQNSTSPKSSICQADMNIGQKTCTSSSLGIIFKYYQDGTVTLIEQNNKITVGGKIIQVFKKDPNDTLIQAIKKQFLQSEPNYCQVNATPVDYLPGFTEEAQIINSIASTPTDRQLCGSFATLQADSIFAYSTDYPNRLYFFNFGQAAYPQLDRNGGDWRQSIQLLQTFGQ